MVAAGYGFHLYLSSFFKKKTLTEGFWVVVVVFFFFFCTNGYFFVCVYMCARAFVFPFSCFLSLQGKVVTFRCRLCLNEFIICHGKDFSSNNGETFSFSNNIIRTLPRKIRANILSTHDMRATVFKTLCINSLNPQKNPLLLVFPLTFEKLKQREVEFFAQGHTIS